MGLTERIADMVDGRVVVAGSLPPFGADLDLLVRPAQAEALAAGLAAAGFERRGRVWARFADCEAEVVELAPVAALRLPADEVERLFEEATPLEALGRVCRPAPHHAILILSGRIDARGPRHPAQARRAHRCRARPRPGGVREGTRANWGLGSNGLAAGTGGRPSTRGHRSRGRDQKASGRP